MASCSLFQPPMSGLTSQSLNRPVDVSSSHSPHPSSALVSSSAHLKVEAASICNSASLKSHGHGSEHFVSEFWSTNSRRGLLARSKTSELARRPGSALIVVRFHISAATEIFFDTLLWHGHISGLFEMPCYEV